MNRNTPRARAIAIAEAKSNAMLVLARCLMLAAGATAACIALMALRGL